MYYYLRQNFVKVHLHEDVVISGIQMVTVILDKLGRLESCKVQIHVPGAQVVTVILSNENIKLSTVMFTRCYQSL